MMHIIERFFIHFGCSTLITMIFYFAITYWIRKNWRLRNWMGLNYLLVIAALLVAALLPLREPYDIYVGNNSMTKSIFDQLSWFLGAGVSAWGLYRFRKD
jgi:putative effector of murein hydrolase